MRVTVASSTANDGENASMPASPHIPSINVVGARELAAAVRFTGARMVSEPVYS